MSRSKRDKAGSGFNGHLVDCTVMSHQSIARDLTEPLRRRISPVRRWLTRVVLEEDVFLFLLGARWFSLLPPLFALLWRPEIAPLPWALFFVAIAVNLALNL